MPLHPKTKYIWTTFNKRGELERLIMGRDQVHIFYKNEIGMFVT